MQNRQKIALEYAIKYLHTSAISKHISDVILYGSVARGEERFKSDVDILIILHDDFLATYENKKMSGILCPTLLIRGKHLML